MKERGRKESTHSGRPHCRDSAVSVQAKARGWVVFEVRAAVLRRLLWKSLDPSQEPGFLDYVVGRHQEAAQREGLQLGRRMLTLAATWKMSWEQGKYIRDRKTLRKCLHLQEGGYRSLKLGSAVEWDKGGRFERFFSSTDNTGG